MKRKKPLLLIVLTLLIFSCFSITASAAYRNCLRTVKGKIYYYDNQGKKVKKAWKTIDGNRYYFYAKDGHAATGMKKIAKKNYCFSSKGVMRTGWVISGKKTYYFDPKTGIRTTGRKKIDGKYYYFDKSGVMAKKKWISGKYYDKDGVYDSTKKMKLEKLDSKLRKAIKHYYGSYSIYVKNLNTGDSLTINNKKRYAASLIKLYAMAGAYEKINQKKFKESSVKSTIRSMITVSSNDAFNSIVRKIGKRYINTWCKEHGYTQTQQYHGLHPSSNADGLTTSSKSNMTSVVDCGKLLESIYNGTCVSPSASKKMLSVLKKQERRSKIPAGVPRGVTVANKTGETDDTTHDVAIVYSKGATYILCVMCSAPNYGWSAASNITKISRIVYNYFN